MVGTARQRYQRFWFIIAAGFVMALLLQAIVMMRPASAVVSSVKIGQNTRSVDGVNVSRGTNQLILYTYSTSQTRTPTNQYGVEVAVNANNVITAVNNRLQTGSASGTTIPNGGYVLSGHGWGVTGSGYMWLLNNATVGASVQLIGDTPPSDTTAPNVAMTAPTNGSTVVLGDPVTFAANASDAVGVSKVEFLVNGSVVGTGTAAPYRYTWSTSGKAAGTYTVAAKAYDAAGNTATASSVTVVLQTPAVTPANTVRIGANTRALDGTNTARGVNQLIRYTYSAGQTVTPTNQYGIEVAVNASNVITAVNNRVQTGSTSGTAIPSGGYVLSGHGWGVSDSGYTWLLSNASVGATVVLGGQPQQDTVSPSVSVTSPTGGTALTIGDTLNVTATATDNVGVARVEFLVNGTSAYSDTSAPYAYSWNTSGLSAGTYTIVAKAYDAAGNSGVSGTVQVTLANPTPPSGEWLSGVATAENGNGVDPAKYFGDWRGSTVEIGQTWPNTPDVWGINPSVANSWSGFTGPMSLSYTPGPDWQGVQGWRSWSAMANGNMDAWWRAAARQTKEFRQGKGTTYVSPFYEYNGDWMTWSVPRTTQGMADFRAAWERVAAIWRQEFPGVKLVLPAACSRDVPQAMMPNVNSYDHIGCTIYNAWPWEANGATAVQRLEVGRQRALANGKSLVITEWANSANSSVPGGGGDAPGFIQAFHDYFEQHGGTGPGQLEFEAFFNIDGYDLDHILLRRNGSQIITSPTQPQTAAKYQQLF